jgi:ATP-binding cassette subfamily C protein CydCD
VVLVRGAAVARPLLRYLERLVSHEVALARLGAWRSRVYAALVPRLPGADRTRRGELLTRVVEDVDARIDGLLRGRLPAASAALALAAAVAAAALVLPAAAAALLAGLAITAGLAPAVAARHAARSDAATAGARARLREAVVETVDGVEELAVRPPEAALAVPRNRSRALSRLEARSARAAGAAAMLAHLGWGVAVAGTALAAASVHGAEGAAGAPAGGAEAAAAVLLGVVALGEAALALPDAAVARRRARGATTRLAAMGAGAGVTFTGRRAGSPTIPSGATGAGLEARTGGGPAARTGGGPGGVVVRGLVAGWDGDRPPALRDLDLDLPAGSRVAVRGASGSGKSTLAAVLAGLLAPCAGTVTPAGRAAGGLVGDGVDHVFASTVRENLRLARPAATDAELRDVLVRVRLADWLAALPAGLDTWLGEGGTTLSGGERRRLVTARALLAAPALLVLDEPTEGLDEPTADALMADLLGAAGGRSVLLLTHRQEGLDLVDAVYDLAGGRLHRPDAVHPARGTLRRPAAATP